MEMGRKRQRQETLWVATQELPRRKGHVFYDRVNRILGEQSFDGFAAFNALNATQLMD